MVKVRAGVKVRARARARVKVRGASPQQSRSLTPEGRSAPRHQSDQQLLRRRSSPKLHRHWWAPSFCQLHGVGGSLPGLGYSSCEPYTMPRLCCSITSVLLTSDNTAPVQLPAINSRFQLAKERVPGVISVDGRNRTPTDQLPPASSWAVPTN